MRRRFALAGLALLVVTAAAPWRFVLSSAIPTASLLDIGLLGAAAVALVLALVAGRMTTGPLSLVAALAVAPIVSALSALWADDPVAVVRGTVIAVEALVAYLVAVALAAALERRTVARAVAAFVFTSLLVSALFYLRVPGFGLYIPPGQREDIARLVSALTRLSHPFIGLSNDYAPLLGAAALLCAGLAVRLRESTPVRAASWAAALAALGVVLTLSRGTLIAFVPATLAFLLLVGLRWRPVLLAGVTATLLLVGGRAAIDRFEIQVGGRTVTGEELFADRFRNTGNVSNRLDRFEATWSEAATRPYLGAGAGTFDPSGNEILSDASHNTVLEQLLFFGGLLGTIVAAAWLALPALLWRAFPPSRAAPERAALVAVAAMLVVASLTQTFMEATVPRVIVHLLLGLGVGAAMPRDETLDQAAA